MTKKIVLLVDYRGAFWSKIGNQRTLCTLDVKKIRDILFGFELGVSIVEFSEVNLSEDWRDVVVVPTSSEDHNLLYKSYIEDIVLGLEDVGAIVLPSYKYIRAHHNKVMMEMLRYSIFPEEAKYLDTKFFGTHQEFERANLSEKWPKVIKSAFGAGATTVALAANNLELIKLAKKFSLSLTAHDIFREFRARLFWRGYSNRSLHRKKFIVQNFIKNLSGDFKVLKYGKRFYLLSRSNRPGDFRASGSGRFSFSMPDYVNEFRLLDYAEEVSEKIGTPFCSMDIGFDGENFHLLEFQCLNFGSLTAENSEYFNVKNNKTWNRVYEKCDLEYIFSEALRDFLINSLDVGE